VLNKSETKAKKQDGTTDVSDGLGETDDTRKLELFITCGELR